MINKKANFTIGTFKPNHFAFSLAEALITLLIISLIMIASTPILTKKVKKRPNQQLWTVNRNNINAISPTGTKSIALNKTNSIIITDTLYFKNQKGEIIGWIAEDGTSSFNCNNYPEYNYDMIIKNQEQILHLVNLLQKSLIDSKNSRQNNSKQKELSEEELEKQLNDIIKLINTTTIKK